MRGLYLWGFWRETGSRGPPHYPTAGFPLSSMAPSPSSAWLSSIRHLGSVWDIPVVASNGPNTSLLMLRSRPKVRRMFAPRGRNGINNEKISKHVTVDTFLALKRSVRLSQPLSRVPSSANYIKGSPYRVPHTHLFPYVGFTS